MIAARVLLVDLELAGKETWVRGSPRVDALLSRDVGDSTASNLAPEICERPLDSQKS
jgi:hypothetical protein